MYSGNRYAILENHGAGHINKSDDMKNDELQMIIKAAELVNSNVRLEDALKNIVDVATNLTHADRGTLYLIDKDKNELWSLVMIGDEIREIRLKMGEGLAGYVAVSGETVNIKDVKKDPRFNPEVDRSSGYKTNSMLCFPIRNSKNEIIGVLQLLNSSEGEFSARDEKFLAALSIHSALAINNALQMQRQIAANEALKKAYKELEIAKQEAEKFAMLKSHFLSQMSHEIRTPFNIIIGGIELLKFQTSSADPELKETFDLMETGSRRIIRTMDEIIEMSKLKSGNYEVHFENIDLDNEILLKIVDTYKALAEEKGIELDYQNTAGDSKVQADNFMLFQIFNEIIDNAVKYTSRGGVDVRLSRTAGGKLCVKVKDTGVGISKEYLAHIFEPFTQEETGYTRKFEGNGLAMALAKKYAELNNLSISVSSAKNEGTEFTVSFN